MIGETSIKNQSQIKSIHVQELYIITTIKNDLNHICCCHLQYWCDFQLNEQSKSSLCGNDRSSGVLKVVDDYFSNDPAKRASARKKHGDIENWDVSRITNMDNLFLNKTTFNADLSYKAKEFSKSVNQGAVINLGPISSKCIAPGVSIEIENAVNPSLNGIHRIGSLLNDASAQDTMDIIWNRFVLVVVCANTMVYVLVQIHIQVILVNSNVHIRYW